MTGRDAEVIRNAITKLQEFYVELDPDHSLEYDFGFFDAVSVLEEMIRNGR